MFVIGYGRASLPEAFGKALRDATQTEDGEQHPTMLQRTVKM